MIHRTKWKAQLHARRRRQQVPACAVPTSFLAVVWRLIFSAGSFPTFCSACQVNCVIVRHFNRFCYSLTRSAFVCEGRRSRRCWVTSCWNWSVEWIISVLSVSTPVRSWSRVSRLQCALPTQTNDEYSASFCAVLQHWTKYECIAML